MKFNNVIETLRCWCAQMTWEYRDQYERERQERGKSSLFHRYAVTNELYQKLGTLIDREFLDYKSLLREIRVLAAAHWKPTLFQTHTEEETAHIRGVKSAFWAYLETVDPNCPRPEVPYYRGIMGKEAGVLMVRFRDRWNYDPAEYWYPLKGCPDDQKLFLNVNYAEPYFAQINSLLGLPEVHIYEYGECDPRYPACAECDEIDGYCGCEVAYTDRDFQWIIYYSHEDTVTFAGSILPQIKEILANEKEHWNKWN